LHLFILDCVGRRALLGHGPNVHSLVPLFVRLV
jgi:hypothetical protein